MIDQSLIDDLNVLMKKYGFADISPKENKALMLKKVNILVKYLENSRDLWKNISYDNQKTIKRLEKYGS
jgi:hypothetical protein